MCLSIREGDPADALAFGNQADEIPEQQIDDFEAIATAVNHLRPLVEEVQRLLEENERIAELEAERPSVLATLGYDYKDEPSLRDGGRPLDSLVAEVLGQAANHLAETETKHAPLVAENERLRLRVLSAAGDDLCRLTQEEIKELSSGKVKIPPEEEFLASCKNFHSQIAGEAGVLPGCLTSAQMIAENERLRMMAREITCVWCGHQFVTTLQSQAEELYEHAKHCDKHPVKKAEAERDRLQAALDFYGISANEINTRGFQKAASVEEHK
jgi:hypothetical protein